MFTRIVTLSFLCISLACGGGIESNDPRQGDGLARAMFEADIAPILQNACASCHGNTTPPLFLGTADGDTDRMYNAIESGGYITPFAGNRLMQKGEHAGGAGRALTADELDLGKAWLETEMAERNGSGDPTGNTTVTAGTLDAFAACMTLDDWRDAGLDDLAAQETAGASKCQSCHQDGQGGVLLSNNVSGTFDFHKQNARLIASATGGDYAVAPIYAATGSRAGHPTYLLSADMNQALADFVAATSQRVADGLCGQ